MRRINLPWRQGHNLGICHSTHLCSSSYHFLSASSNISVILLYYRHMIQRAEMVGSITFIWFPRGAIDLMQRQATSSSHKIFITASIFKFVISRQKRCISSSGNQGGCEVGRGERATSTPLQETCLSAHEMTWNDGSEEFSTSPQHGLPHNFLSSYYCCYHLWKK